ncbi:MAG: hypothetical protein Q8L48_38505 [Archangium sp.]|nr:hypothetical protein [Archangium sp.]
MGEEETPWAMVQGLRIQNAPLDQIVEALQQRGLERDDIELLMKDAPELVPAPAPVQPTLVELPRDAGPAEPAKPGHSIAAWIGIVLSALGSIIGGWGAMGFGLKPPHPFLPWFILLVLSLLAFLGLLVSEARKGVRRTAKNLGFVLFFVCIVPTLGGLIGGWGLLPIVCAAGFLSSIPMLVWGSISGERLPGVGSLVRGATVFESHDVQFIVVVPERPAPTVAPGDYVEVLVVAQNCVDVPRQLLVEVVGEPRALAQECRHAFQLAPGALVEHVIPVRVGALAPPWCNFLIDVAGRGVGGRRVRLAKGKDWLSPREKRLEQVADLVGAAWDVANSGVGSLATFGLDVLTTETYGSFRVKCYASQSVVREARSPTVITRFAPTSEELAAAATS